MDRNGGVATLFGIATVASFLAFGGAVGFAQSPSGPPRATHIVPVLAPIAKAGVNIEVSLMLDVTRSMEGDKLSGLKAAAKDLVDIVVVDDQGPSRSRVALVPFSDSVRLPEPAYQGAVDLIADPSNTPSLFTKDVTQWHWYHGWQTVNQTYYKTRCLVERTGTQAFTDAAPGPGAYVATVARSESPENCGQAVANTITPLTNNKIALDAAITKLTASSSGAAGHLGAAWAWYAVSPKWNALWASAANHASAYEAHDTRKIAVLMSDGAFNTQYTKDGFASAPSEAPNGSSIEQTRQLCSAMKASGLIVYTVGLDLEPDSSIAQTLMQCATDASKAMRAKDGNDLRQAFRTIAHDITKSGLSS